MPTTLLTATPDFWTVQRLWYIFQNSKLKIPYSHAVGLFFQKNPFGGEMYKIRRMWNIRQVHRITWSRFDEVSLGSSSEGEVKIWMLTSHNAKKYFLKENSYFYAHGFLKYISARVKKKMREFFFFWMNRNEAASSQTISTDLL